ncbi:MAG: diaminopimelate epimerase [Sandaracinaceae bacterium]|nr:diaminopimelate epimerase [Sandaracinaceae bacterium]
MARDRRYSFRVELRFEKYEGLGNDFLVVGEGAALAPGVAERLCDRHRGVGGDGVLVTGVEGGRPFMRVRNADGSAPEMCGNGVRCVALYLHARGLVGDAFELDTDAGPHAVRVLGDGRVEVAMRPPSLAPRDLPLDAPAPWVDEPIEVGGVALRVTAVSMGNPHAVTFDAVDPARVGPVLERDPRFPARVNAGFATRTEAGLDLVVWERGVGFTEACGTGACAAGVAAVETGRARRGEDVVVRLPGGELVIRVGAPGAPVLMTGPARRVFSGVVEV